MNQKIIIGATILIILVGTYFLFFNHTVKLRPANYDSERELCSIAYTECWGMASCIAPIKTAKLGETITIGGVPFTCQARSAQ